MRVHPSALKHGISADDAIQAAHWSQWIEPLEEADWPHRELRLGFDTRARLLETVVLVFQSGASRPLGDRTKLKQAVALFQLTV